MLEASNDSDFNQLDPLLYQQQRLKAWILFNVYVAPLWSLSAPFPSSWLAGWQNGNSQLVKPEANPVPVREQCIWKGVKVRLSRYADSAAVGVVACQGRKVTTQKARAGSTGRRESTRVEGEQVGGEMCKGSGGGALSYIKFVRFWFLQPHGLTTACVVQKKLCIVADPFETNDAIMKQAIEIINYWTVEHVGAAADDRWFGNWIFILSFSRREFVVVSTGSPGWVSFHVVKRTEYRLYYHIYGKLYFSM